MTKILGISAFYHDSAAALLVDGKIIAAAQEERFTRKKHDSSYPSNSIKYVLSEAETSFKEIDYVVFYEKPFLKFERILETFVANAPYSFNQFMVAIPEWIKNKLYLKNNIAKEIKNIYSDFDEKKILFSEHHLSHAASAFFVSPYKKAAVITIDAVGEWATTTIGIGSGNNLEIIKEIKFPNSLGLFYSAFTYYLGFKVNSGEYKVMGLAPYGKPIYRNLILENLIDLKNDGSFRLNQKYFNYTTEFEMISHSFVDLFGEPTRKNDDQNLTQFHMDIAASIQSVTEEVVLRIARWTADKYKLENLCLAGGVALNCVANGKILKEKIFKNVWVQPAAGDAGGAIGACLAVWHLFLEKPKIEFDDKQDDFMSGSYLGPKFNDSEIEKSLKDNKIIYQKLNKSKLINDTATLLSKDKIIGWFHGRMEFGPRALGNRSILANPMSNDMQSKLNLKVKFREGFRPFAPAILFEDQNEWFEEKFKSPYMSFVDKLKSNKCYDNEFQENQSGFDLLKIKRSDIQAVTHVDYTARVQTVHEETNKMFYDLLSAFKDKTGCPILINTSFNVRGEPIVNEPYDAIRCFMTTNIDYLVIGSFFVSKEDQNLSQINSYKREFTLD